MYIVHMYIYVHIYIYTYIYIIACMKNNFGNKERTCLFGDHEVHRYVLWMLCIGIIGMDDLVFFHCPIHSGSVVWEGSGMKPIWCFFIASTLW